MGSKQADREPSPTLSSVCPPVSGLPRIRETSLQQMTLPTCVPGDSIHQNQHPPPTVPEGWGHGLPLRVAQPREAGVGRAVLGAGGRRPGCREQEKPCLEEANIWVTDSSLPRDISSL